MGLTQKILLFTSALVVALVAITLAFTTVQADRLADANVRQALAETREVWQTFQADRYSKLKLGVRVLGNDPAFKAAVGTDQATVYDMLRERGQDLGADFFIATDPEGVVIARSDRPGGQGEDLSRDPLVMKPLEGEESATVWRQGDRLYHAVSVPMQFGEEIVGVLIAGYGIDEGVAQQIRRLTHNEVAYLTETPDEPARFSLSSLGPKEGAFKEALDSPAMASGGTEPFELDLAGEPYVAVAVPLMAATGETVGRVVALRSLAVEMAPSRQFRNSLVLVALVVMAGGLGIAFLAARRITGPVRLLVNLVERARSGSYSGAVAVDTSDEIGVLARTFNSLLADLREKEQMIAFLREGMTLLKKKAGAAPGPSPTFADAPTATLHTASSTASGIASGAVFAGRYEVLEVLGRGGMGVVYRARDRQLDEVVALKVLRSEVLKEDPTLLERFKQELKLARRITHPNVLRTHDFGEANGTPYISMEYLDGVTLKDLVRSKGALPAAVGLRIAKQVCQGLEAAHQQGVVHRDIKPQNMLILPETGEVKIMDFGIARVSSVKDAAALTTAGTVMGTADYMAPEQGQGRPADFRSDIYSLGVVFYEMFAGRLPFDGDTPLSIVLKHVQEPPPPPRRANPRLPEDLEAVILRCMDKVPARRYGRVVDILNALSAVSARLDASVPPRAASA